jgi:hypothetical protein
MSVVLDRPVTRQRFPETDVPVVLRPRIPVEPEVRPRIHVPVETPAVAPRRKASPALRTCALKVALFTGIFAGTYVVSCLSGFYLEEQSRSVANDAAHRATAALREERDVQHRLNELTSAASIEAWALTHGFHTTDGLGQTSTVDSRVASND